MKYLKSYEKINTPKYWKLKSVKQPYLKLALEKIGMDIEDNTWWSNILTQLGDKYQNEIFFIIDNNTINMRKWEYTRTTNMREIKTKFPDWEYMGEIKIPEHELIAAKYNL